MRDVCIGTVLLILIWTGVGAQAAQPAQTTGTDFLVPFPAHHVIGNIYFVGATHWAFILFRLHKGTS